MKLCFLGQQGWLLSTKNHSVLIDPVLKSTFGTSSEVRFRLYPPRDIEINKMPIISAVFISNEHLDHFHLPSLLLLDRKIPIYIGQLTPDCVTKRLIKHGFNVCKVADGEKVILDELEVNFYRGSDETAFWEMRVYQLVLHENINEHHCVFIQSDTLSSSKLKNDIKSGKICLLYTSDAADE